ncbi:uncharacterized protein LOC122498296 [Leptopilina heterotoma]|uniref:uncharacterized protein LOC122498296 n=1 Tax=Leptopilina heterotoma TaxID=63436 RepID=UPI001CA9A291|nr:uncharacterized protein LOC122498296 [Leptopilina heterotoma]
MEDIYLDLVGETKSILFSLPGNLNQSTIQSDHQLTATENAARSTIRAPPISLPTFSGSHKDWVTFNDYFTSLIINHNNFDDYHTLHNLKSCLDGEAAKLLSDVPVTATGFQTAWSKLKNRHSNKRCILNTHLTNLFSIKSIANSSPGSLSKLLDSAIESIQAMHC